MNRYLFLAAAALAWASAAGSAEGPTKAEDVIEDPQPRNPLEPVEPPSPSVPKPLPGKPAPPPPGFEGTGRPVPAKTDTELIRELTTALLDDPSTPRVQGLTISIKDGRATLRGVARSIRDKDAVTAKAGAVAGLRNVSNMITVAP
jgi:hypothetical protein